MHFISLCYYSTILAILNSHQSWNWSCNKFFDPAGNRTRVSRLQGECSDHYILMSLWIWPSCLGSWLYNTGTYIHTISNIENMRHTSILYYHHREYRRKINSRYTYLRMYIGTYPMYLPILWTYLYTFFFSSWKVDVWRLFSYFFFLFSLIKNLN